MEGFWTEERTARGRELWGRGMGPKAVAAELGTSGSAVSHKAIREGWMRNPQPDPDAPEVQPDLLPPHPILGLDDTHCRWIIGEPHTGDYRYCRMDRVTGFSYCAYHTRMAYTGAARR